MNICEDGFTNMRRLSNAYCYSHDIDSGYVNWGNIILNSIYINTSLLLFRFGNTLC